MPVVGDRAPEPDEELSVLLGNAGEATLVRSEATVRVLDDDAGPNQPPSPHAGRLPADGATGVPVPRLSWASSDPDPGDILSHDLYVGTAFTTGGQQWLPVCAGGAWPGPRWGAVVRLRRDGRSARGVRWRDARGALRHGPARPRACERSGRRARVAALPRSERPRSSRLGGWGLRPREQPARRLRRVRRQL